MSSSLSTPSDAVTHAALRALTRSLRERRDAVAIRTGEPAREVTYAELARLVARHAAGLAGLGLARGARVAVLASPRLEAVVGLLAHYQRGLVHVPINTRYRAAEVAHILADSGAAAVVTDSAGLAVLDDVARAHPDLATLPRIQLDAEAPVTERDHRFADLMDATVEEPADGHGGVAATAHRDDDVALMIYTSGTTGRSKGVALTMRAVVTAIDALTTLWQWSSADRLVLALPLFHVHGLAIGIHGGLLHGLSVDLLPRFQAPAVVRAIERGGTIFMGVPTMYRMLLDHLEAHPADAAVLARARLYTAGSAALPSADFHTFERLTGHRILERYGMSETLLTLSNPGVGERRPGSVGMPVPGFEIRVVGDDGRDCDAGQPGELWVRGAGLMRGYWNQPEATAAAFRDGWFMTGDVVARDADGYVRILGRRSVDIIKSGGFKISAREIEEVLLAHPKVNEVAIVGVADERWGQRIVAAVVLEPSATSTAVADAEPARDDGEGADQALLVELSGYVADHLADYKKPRGLVVVDELPRNALGKIQKARLIDELERGARTCVALPS